MKFSTVTKTMWASAIALGVATLPFNLPASAQQPAPGQPNVIETEAEDDFDWGWLGLLGLIGLAGLAGRSKDRDRTSYREPNVGTTTTRSDRTF
ncbi:WGxxGxxG-CTERM domain-containing protein [Pleurocapsales cyanobacterium LEGE 06147]|nr:WGxxGxxG-CTERM domain-containing protein [Pleurocapsales cyanobacterium LEGE 06147]